MSYEVLGLEVVLKVNGQIVQSDSHLGECFTDSNLSDKTHDDLAGSHSSPHTPLKSLSPTYIGLNTRWYHQMQTPFLD